MAQSKQMRSPESSARKSVGAAALNSNTPSPAKRKQSIASPTKSPLAPKRTLRKLHTMSTNGLIRSITQLFPQYPEIRTEWREILIQKSKELNENRQILNPHFRYIPSRQIM